MSHMTKQPWNVSVEGVALEARAAELSKRSIKKASKEQALTWIIQMMDLTTLEGADTDGNVLALCRKAVMPSDRIPDLPSVAAVCVYPKLISVAKQALKGTSVKVASVATGFPSGQTSLDVKCQETEWAVHAGADEIDMVISRGALISGKLDQVSNEITVVKKSCGDAHLKVILETGELGSYELVREACFVAMDAGADFIKTSTGKISPAATLPITLLMLEAIRDFYLETGKKIGMKPAGGIRKAKDGIRYLVLVNETLGDDWLTPDMFRLGASSLLNDVLMQLEKLQDGVYQSSTYYSLPY